MSRIFFTFLACCAGLTACGGGSGGGAGTVSSNELTAAVLTTVPAGATEVNVGLTAEENVTVSDASVGLVAFVTGFDTANQRVEGHAGVREGATVGPAVTSGTATYSTTYAFDFVRDVQILDDSIVGNRRRIGNTPISLTADFNTGKLTGSDGLLTVDGTISGQTVGGTVTIPTLPNSAVQGQIGATGVIGAFAGSDEDTVVVGGFVGKRD